jgi:alkylated DNA repair dioxygenase AlkB
MDLFSNHNQYLPFPLPKGAEYSFTWQQAINMFEIQIPNGKLYYNQTFFETDKSNYYFDHFLQNSEGLDLRNTDWRIFEKDKLNTVNFNNIRWHHDSIKMYGKDVYLPRYSAWYGDNDKPYTYSGLTLQPNPWNACLLEIKERIEKTIGCSFNSVLMNWYRDGSDHIGWHTDAEKELGFNPIIGSVNLGSTRHFYIRRKDNHDIKINIPLSHGSLLLMTGELQHFWQHAILKETTIRTSRINLTFRKII